MREQHDEPLEEEEFDIAATRPPLLFGLPYSLSGSLLFVGMMFLMLHGSGDWVQDLTGDAVAIGAVGMVWSAAKVMLRADYHGWDIFVAWASLDARCLDTREWGGARLASFPLRSIFRTGGGDA